MTEGDKDEAEKELLLPISVLGAVHSTSHRETPVSLREVTRPHLCLVQ